MDPSNKCLQWRLRSPRAAAGDPIRELKTYGRGGTTPPAIKEVPPDVYKLNGEIVTKSPIFVNVMGSLLGPIVVSLETMPRLYCLCTPSLPFPRGLVDLHIVPFVARVR